MNNQLFITKLIKRRTAKTFSWEIGTDTDDIQSALLNHGCEQKLLQYATTNIKIIMKIYNISDIDMVNLINSLFNETPVTEYLLNIILDINSMNDLYKLIIIRNTISTTNLSFLLTQNISIDEIYNADKRLITYLVSLIKSNYILFVSVAKKAIEYKYPIHIIEELKDISFAVHPDMLVPNMTVNYIKAYILIHDTGIHSLRKILSVETADKILAYFNIRLNENVDSLCVSKFITDCISDNIDSSIMIDVIGACLYIKK